MIRHRYRQRLSRDPSDDAVLERLLFRHLAVFPAGFTVDAAAAVIKDTTPEPLAVEEVIANLVAKSLIALRSDTVSRWNLLETIRAYALGDKASEEARLCFEEARASDPGFTLYWVLHDGQCRIALITGDLAAAETAITAISDCAARLDYPLSNVWLGPNTTVMAWKGKLLIEHGEFAKGVALVQQAVQTGEQPGWRMCHAEFLGYFAEGLAGLGQLDEAAEAIKRAIARAEHGGEGLYHAELIRLRGELLLRRSADTHTQETEDCSRRANELARTQGALFWELRIAPASPACA